MDLELPVDALRAAFIEAIGRGPVVLSSPTGSGKSTSVPRWCEGRVLVVEPRRIACRSLAARVAALEGVSLGDAVGYVVRDERVLSDATRIVFVTPGMVLRDRALLGSARTVILDEFHERSLEVDLLLALLLRKQSAALAVMSATLEGERVARHVNGVHLTAEGRAFPVELRYLPGQDVLPESGDLPARVERALLAAARDPGDVLVFLPGKGEIEACVQRLTSSAHTIIPLHGGLTLDEQRRAFESTARRKVILATNVAETSLTIPGIGVVIDAGLVRQTRYHDGRGYLALVPIADDSAAQRAGRAGRTRPGVCYRLWSSSARLHATTPPEIHRESLVPLILTASAWGERVEALPLLDPPKPYALEAARAELAGWGALHGDSDLSASGHSLFALPIAARHGRLLIAAREQHCLDDMIDLVSVLSVGRPLFAGHAATADAPDELRFGGCDATAAITAIRAVDPAELGASLSVVREARATRSRLRSLERLSSEPAAPRAIDRDALVRAALVADARLAHVGRRRGRELFFSNGGTEVALARESAARGLRDVEALIALETRAFGSGRDAKVLVTCALAVPLALLARAALGSERLASVQLAHGRVRATVERVYAQRVIAVREESPQGELLRAALVELLSRGSLYREAVATTRQRLTQWSLAAWMAARGHPAGVTSDEARFTLEQWLAAKVATLGVESAEDLALLSAGDFVARELPYETRCAVESEYPLTVSVGDASYRADYELEHDRVTLHMIRGTRRDPPTLAFLPKFPGLRISVEGPRGLSVLRARG